MTIGRPEKLTPEIQTVIVSSILAGGYVETAAAFAGISKTTFYEWMKKGAKASKGKYHDFSNAVKKAQAEAELRDVMVVNRAAQSSWQAAAWKLERKYPDRWGRRENITMTGSEKPITIQYSQLDKAE